MRTAAYKVDVASDRRRRENVPRHILCSITKAEKLWLLKESDFRWIETEDKK